MSSTNSFFPFIFPPFITPYLLSSFVFSRTRHPVHAHGALRTGCARSGRSWRGRRLECTGLLGYCSPWLRPPSSPLAFSWLASSSSICPSCRCCASYTCTWQSRSERNLGPKVDAGENSEYLLLLFEFPKTFQAVIWSPQWFYQRGWYPAVEPCVSCVSLGP